MRESPLQGTCRVAGKTIRFTCPVCNAVGKIRVDDLFLGKAITGKSDRLIELHVFPGDACEHGFVIKVDATLRAR